MSILIWIWDVLKYPMCFVLFIIQIYIILVNIWQEVEMKKRGMKKLPRTHKRILKRNKLKELFVDFPRMIAIDRISKNPDAFGEKGVIIFEGMQGQGKTISLIHYAEQLMYIYPELKCTSNLYYKNATDKLTNWKKLITYKNGEYGVLAIIDETQNWFSSKDSKNFPPEMLSVVTQNRKNRRIIFGTAQNFYMLAKDIRTQCTEVRTPHTFFNALTIVIKYQPICDSDGTVIRRKLRGWYWFVHTPELRNAYDTYETINRMSQSGFVDRAEKQNVVVTK